MKKLVKHLSNIPGWTTKRRIVVLESDDWGAIRMSSNDAFKELQGLGVVKSQDNSSRYNRFDSLASESDFDALFSVLKSFHDFKGNHPVFTALAIMANPDFDRIKRDGYNNYYYETFEKTLLRYPNHKNSFDYWLEGIREGIFVPQFHGREHLNATSWIKALKQGNIDTISAFDRQVYGIKPRDPINHVAYQAAFDIDDTAELEYLKYVIEDGLKIFKKLFGYNATFFVPTNGPFNNSLEEGLAHCGIKFIGTSKIQNEPLGNGKSRKVFHYLGQRNKFGQVYMTRNCIFEPCGEDPKKVVENCLNDVSIAFKWNKPAIISSHRVNYVGFLQESNRVHGLKCLEELLNQILQKWPDVEFMSSADLGNLIDSST